MANFNKVIKVLNIKSAVNLLWTSARPNRDNAFDSEILLSALSWLRFLLESIAILYLKFYIFVKINHPHVIFYKQVILKNLNVLNTNI